MRFFLILLFLLMTTALSAKENVGHTLYFQTLSQLPETEALNYIKNFRHILSQNSSYEVAQALKTKTNPTCHKKKMKTCHPGLYGEDVCIAKSKKTLIACAKVGKRKRLHTFFKDPAFHRVAWNSLSLQINRVCSKKKHFTCLKLFQLKESTLKRNRRHLEKTQRTSTVN